jgi:hypothetical protein
MVPYTVPGMGKTSAETLTALLQDRLDAQFHWFVRAHLERADGALATGTARTERSAATRASKR